MLVGISTIAFILEKCPWAFSHHKTSLRGKWVKHIGHQSKEWCSSPCQVKLPQWIFEVVCPSSLCILKCSASQIGLVEPMSCSKNKDPHYSMGVCKVSSLLRGSPPVFFFLNLACLWLSFVCYLSFYLEAFPQLCPQSRIFCLFPTLSYQ